MSEPVQYVVRGLTGDVFGPAPLETLRAWVQEGRIVGDMGIAEAGTQNWQPARIFPGLADLFAAQPTGAAATATTTTVTTPAASQPLTPQYYGPATTTSTDPLALASLVCSGLGLIMAVPGICCCFLDCLAVPLAVVGIIMGFIALSRTSSDPSLGGRPMAKIGIALGFAALAVLIGGFLISFALHGVSAFRTSGMTLPAP